MRRIFYNDSLSSNILGRWADRREPLDKMFLWALTLLMRLFLHFSNQLVYFLEWIALVLWREEERSKITGSAKSQYRSGGIYGHQVVTHNRLSSGEYASA